MRIYTQKCTWRRGATMVEAICSLVIVAMLAMIVISTSTVLRHNTSVTNEYLRLRVSATNTLEKIKKDLQDGVAIDSMDYSYKNSSQTSESQIEVIVTEVGLAFSYPLYHVIIRADSTVSGMTPVTIESVLRAPKAVEPSHGA